jgi:hypothetical protein
MFFNENRSENMLNKLIEASQNEEKSTWFGFYLFIMIWINRNLQHAAHVIHWEGTARHGTNSNMNLTI